MHRPDLTYLTFRLNVPNTEAAIAALQAADSEALAPLLALLQSTYDRGPDGYAVRAALIAGCHQHNREQRAAEAL